MSGNNTSYTHWKSNVSLDIIATGSGNYNNVLKLGTSSGGGGGGSGLSGTATVTSQPISMATLTAITTNEHVPISSTTNIGGHSQSIGHVLNSSASIYSPATLHRQHSVQTSTNLPSHHPIDVYSQMGMQRLGQMYKSNVMTNNNNNNNINNNNHNNHNKCKQSADGSNSEQNLNSVQQLVESAIG